VSGLGWVLHRLQGGGGGSALHGHPLDVLGT
jgi:hypothetical protein